MESHQALNGAEVRQSRLRVKHACVPCKDRKRRCDGEHPCSTCTRYEYDCVYEESSRKRRRRTVPISLEHESIHHSGSDEAERTVPALTLLDLRSQEPRSTDRKKSKEASAESVFARLLGHQLDADRASEQQLLAWNIGMSDDLSGLHLAITKILSLEQMQALAQYYFETIHQTTSFLKKDLFDAMVVRRWAKGDIGDPEDPLLCGVAALGSLFSGGSQSPLQSHLVESAKTILEAIDVLSFPTYDQIAGWFLRTIFLRCTARPHAAWIASGMVMHTIEAVGLDDSMKSSPSRGPKSAEVFSSDRLVWLGRLFNGFISNEYGRSRVEIPGSFPPIPLSGDHTSDILLLYQIYESLKSEETNKAIDYERCIASVAALKSQFDAVTLSRANATFKFYRRLRLVSSIVPQETVDQIVTLGLAGLDAAQRVACGRQPWWHVANVPFQFICILLIMDTKDTLAHIGRAMATLQAVSECFPTKSIENSVAAARKLIKLSQQRKLDEVVFLDQGLDGRQYYGNQQPPSTQNTILNRAGPWQPEQDLATMDFGTLDWNPFLSMDIPIFDGGGLQFEADQTLYTS